MFVSIARPHRYRSDACAAPVCVDLCPSETERPRQLGFQSDHLAGARDHDGDGPQRLCDGALDLGVDGARWGCGSAI